MFAIIDCNNFYASCERLFQPELAHRPVIVLSNNDGCVIARSNEAKVLGIQMGAPFFQVQALCKRHQVVVFSSNYTDNYLLYRLTLEIMLFLAYYYNIQD